MQAIRELLDFLDAVEPDAVDRLCSIRDVGGRGRSAKCESLARSYRGDHEDFLTDLRKADLVALATGVPAEHGHRLSSATSYTKDELLEITLRLFRDGEIPSEYEQVVDDDDDLSASDDGDEEGSAGVHAPQHSKQAGDGQPNDDVLEYIRNLDDTELRSFRFQIGGEGPDPGPCYGYQTHGISRVEAGEAASPPVSGILHYPTGAGKTRVGMELIARTLHRDRNHRFVWATDRKLLIRQSMSRMAELGRLFPPNTTLTWAADADEIKSGDESANVVFMTRATLTRVLKQAVDGRTVHAWKGMLADGVPMTLVYDECHQLGADRLQQNWRRFHESVLLPNKARWRTIGLSATPVPTSVEAHSLLRKYIFPQRPGDAASTCHDWPFHFFHRVPNEALIASGVLCPINLTLDRSGDFDFPAPLLKEVIGVLRPPGANASNLEVQEYALKFNNRVLSDSRILAWLADRLGRSIEMLGKTIVFVPTIGAANRLVALLHERFPAARGRVAAVHSKMKEMEVPGQEGETVHRVLDRFRDLGDKPSILVNVEMLTEGFDDPKIRTVVLARLTTSTNRFWQMIGRGTRGPGAKGTADCYVIDPIKLVRFYDYFRGYQPSLTGDVDVEFEDLEQDDEGQGRLSPLVPSISLPPDPRACAYLVDPALDRVQAQVAAALRDFLAGGSISEAKAVEVASTVNVTFAPGAPTLVAGDGSFAPLTAAAVVLGELSALEKRAGRDLSWFRRKLPDTFDEPLLRHHLRMLRAIEDLSVWTESEFATAQMSGAYQRAIQREAAAATTTPVAAASETAPVVPQSSLALTPSEEAVIAVGLALAAVDGQVDASEVTVVVESLRRMFGRPPTDELRRAVELGTASGPDPVTLLREQLPMRLRQLLVFQLAEVAAADGIVTPAERDYLVGITRALGVVDGFVESVLGDVGDPVPTTVIAAPSPTCSSCAFDLPSAALFCPSCGFRRSSVVAT